MSPTARRCKARSSRWDRSLAWSMAPASTRPAAGRCIDGLTLRGRGPKLFPSPARSVPMSQSATNLKPEQKFVFDHVDRNATALGTLGDSIFHFAELGMQEFETSK